MQRFKEWLSIHVSKNPGRVVLAVILLFNIMFFFILSFVIKGLAVPGTEGMGFFEAAFYTLSMMIDSGSFSLLVSDIGQTGTITVLICFFVTIIGMISFTGAVIGYITNYISHLIEKADSDSNRIYLKKHIVILNWNTRASEIINDLLYCKTREKVVVLASSGKSRIEAEIDERISDTVFRENKALREKCMDMGVVKRYFYYRANHLKKNKVTVIVREGDVFSSKKLHDISLEFAKTVIILGNDTKKAECKYELAEELEDEANGNPQTVKTLMQVADITSATYSADNQKIIVEITDNKTWVLVEKIIKYKQRKGKCNIVPVRVNRILGSILAQFSLMPELNLAYKELFSNKGATFFSEPHISECDDIFIQQYLSTHKHAIPLTVMDINGESHAYYSSATDEDIAFESHVQQSDYSVSLNADYWIGKRNVIILGYNSKCVDIMDCFCTFRNEWNDKAEADEILNVLVIDEPRNIKKMNSYREYPFVKEIVSARIYEKDKICEAIKEFICLHPDGTSILILSNDEASPEDIDANTLADLVYVQDTINEIKTEEHGFDVSKVDIIVEITNPKHHDIVGSYSVNNVVISNRYISKMITQIGAKDALFDFYTDILTYDRDDTDCYISKEIYAKKVCSLFKELPAPCTADELIRAVYYASIDESLPKKKRNPTLVLGYMKANGDMVLFEGDQSDIKVELETDDSLIVFSGH